MKKTFNILCLFALLAQCYSMSAMNKEKQVVIKEEDVESEKMFKFDNQLFGELLGKEEEVEDQKKRKPTMEDFLKLKEYIKILRGKKQKLKKEKEILLSKMGILGETNDKLKQKWLEEREVSLGMQGEYLKEKESLVDQIKCLVKEKEILLEKFESEKKDDLIKEEESQKSPTFPKTPEDQMEIWREIEESHKGDVLEIELSKMEGSLDDRKKEESEEESEDDSEEEESEDEFESSDNDQEEFTLEERVQALDEYLLKEKGMFKNKPRGFRYQLYEAFIADGRDYFIKLSTVLCKKKTGKDKGFLDGLIGFEGSEGPQVFSAFISNYEKVSGLLDIAKQQSASYQQQAQEAATREQTEREKVDQERQMTREERQRANEERERANEERRRASNTTWGKVVAVATFCDSKCTALAGCASGFVISICTIGAVMYIASTK